MLDFIRENHPGWDVEFRPVIVVLRCINSVPMASCSEW